MTSGALRATWNSSGALFLALNTAQPLRATAESAQSQAIEALFGGPAPRSQTESQMLDSAGRDRTSVGIRSTAGDPDTRVVDKGPVTTAILNAPEADGQVASAQVPQ